MTQAQINPIEDARPAEMFFDKETCAITDEGKKLLVEAIELLTAISWQNAENKGFHESGRPFSEEIALIHSEVSEALESDRTGEPSLWFKTNLPVDGYPLDSTNEDGSPRKAEGVAAEYADVLIRIGDSCGGRDIPLASALIAKMNYNTTRPYKHGRKF